MAGAVLAPGMQFVNPMDVLPRYLIKSAEVVNEGDLIGLDTNGFIVAASKTQGATVKAIGIAFFDDNNGTFNTKTGDGTTVYCSIAKRGKLLNATSTMVPSLGKGLPIYLGPVPTTTVSNYTCAQSTTNGDLLQEVGYVGQDGVTLHIRVDSINMIKYQTSGNSVVGVA
jgi:hypothetical protein